MEPKDLIVLSIQALKDRRELLAYRTRLYNETATELLTALQDGSITLMQWSTAMKSELKSLHVTSALAGKGGVYAEMTQADWGWVGAKLREQYDYWRQLVDAIARTNALPNNIERRLLAYGEAAGHTMEHFVAVGEQYPMLPYEPRDGSTACMTGCKCTWDVRRLLTSSGRLIGWIVSWVMHPAEHCEDCIERSGTWNKTFVRA